MLLESKMLAGITGWQGITIRPDLTLTTGRFEVVAEVRSKIVLGTLRVRATSDVASKLSITKQTVGKWR